MTRTLVLWVAGGLALGWGAGAWVQGLSPQSAKFAGGASAQKTLQTGEPKWVTPVVRAPRVQHRTFDSAAAKTKVSYHIYTPAVYDTEKERRFPVLYWLHGHGGGVPGIAPVSAHFDRAIREGKIPPMLVVFPNGLTDSMWCDSKDGKVPMETVVVKELVPQIDATFRTIASREGRLIEGFSMGGYGAARLGFKHHNLFAAVSMLGAGPLDPEFKGPTADRPVEVRKRMLQGVSGGDLDYFKAQGPWVLAEENAVAVREKVRVRLVVGERDGMLAQNRDFEAHLTELKIPHTFTVLPDVEHSVPQIFGALGEKNWEFYRAVFHVSAMPQPGAAGLAQAAGTPLRPYVVVDTGQAQCYDDHHPLPAAPRPGESFYGQDAQYSGPVPAYRDNRDGTVSDLNTGLMWVQGRGEKVTWDAAVAGARTCRVGGHNDWRMPSIKELYSLINFSGGFHGSTANSTPYLDTVFFRFTYGDESRGERAIDCQDWTATQYISTTMNGAPTVFGVNFADGRIKGYPKIRHGPPGGGGEANTLFVRYVRGNPAYGKNDFHDSGDGTIADRATGLMWSRADGGVGMNWKAALAWVQKKNAEKYLGHADWRLPNAKELQSIVDYTRSPAIDPVFQITRLSDAEYPFFWSGTTHLDGPADRQGVGAVYICFGRGLGWMQFPPGRGEFRLLDVHGAGAQRSDPKTGDPAAFPRGRGPQGDVIRIQNFVRLVRDIGAGAQEAPPRAGAKKLLVFGDPNPRNPQW